MIRSLVEVLREEFFAFWRVPPAAVGFLLVVIAGLFYLVYSRTVYGALRDEWRQGLAFVVVFAGLAGLARVLKR